MKAREKVQVELSQCLIGNIRTIDKIKAGIREETLHKAQLNHYVRELMAQVEGIEVIAGNYLEFRCNQQYDEEESS